MFSGYLIYTSFVMEHATGIKIGYGLGKRGYICIDW